MDGDPIQNLEASRIEKPFGDGFQSRVVTADKEEDIRERKEIRSDLHRPGCAARGVFGTKEEEGGQNGTKN